MTSVEKLHRFIQEMDKLSAKRQAKISLSSSASDYETNYSTAYDACSVNDIQEELDDEFDENADLNNHRDKMSMSKFRYLIRSHTKSIEEPALPERRLNRFFSLPPEQQEKQLLEIYYQPISQKDIFYRGNVPLKFSNLSRTSCPTLIQIQNYVYEESTTSVSDKLLFYRKGLSFLHTLRRMLGLELFRDYRYIIFFISQFLFYLFYDLIYLFPGKILFPTVFLSSISSSRLR
jgi:hypothetical protein